MQLSVVYRNAMRALRWTVFLAVAALGCWRPVRRPVLLVSLAGLAMLAALLLPAVYVPFASGAWLGALLSLALHDEGRTNPERIGTPACGALQCRSRRRNGRLLFARGDSRCQYGLGAEPAAKPATQPLIPHALDRRLGLDRRLVCSQKQSLRRNVCASIPVDEDDNRQASRIRCEGFGACTPPQWGMKSPRWILTAATYRGSLVWQGPPERLEPGN